MDMGTPDATITAADLAEWFTADALDLAEVGPGVIVGVHSVAKVPQNVNDDDGIPLEKTDEETQAEYLRRKGIQWLRMGYNDINPELDITAADRANSSNAQMSVQAPCPRERRRRSLNQYLKV